MRIGVGRGSAAHGRGVHLAFLLLIAIAVIGTVGYGQAVRLALVTVISAVAVAAIAVGVRLNRVAHRSSWSLLLAATTLFTVFNYLWFIDLGLGMAIAADGPANTLVQMVAFLCVLTAGLSVVRQHGAGDRGGILDAALLGIGLIAPVWEFLLRPHLIQVGASVTTQAMFLLKMLLLMATVGALLRIARTAGTARTSLVYFLISMTSTVVSVTVSLLTSRPGSDDYSPVVDLCAMVGYLALAAAALHPASTEFAQPGGWRRRDLSAVKLHHLGFVLALVPVIGSLPQLFGGEPDSLLLSLGTLLVIPLVIMRIGLLMAQRTADQDALLFQAHHDELTGLINRRRFFSVLAESVDRCRGPGVPALAVLYCDLDNFKTINDEYGHDAGDCVLRTFAERLTGALRSGDIAARIGGDEFLALCPDADPADVEALRRRIEDVAVQPVPWGDHEFQVGVTVGVAVGSGPELSGDALIAAADGDMYRRKTRRRSPVPVR